ncbi:MAG: glycosyltransferase family 9 protein [Anaerolineae bacterium]
MPATRLLAVKLADIGDVILTTPALRALRAALPDAQLDYLTSPNGAAALRGSTLVDDVLTFEKGRFDRLRCAADPSGTAAMARFGAHLRRRRYDAVLLFHHLTTAWGAAKFNGLLAASGAAIRAGIDNGRGALLTHRVPDAGFGVYHEVEYALQVAQCVAEGFAAADYRLDFPISDTADAAAARLMSGLPTSSAPRVAMFPGSGGYSLARRWPAPYFAQVADRLARQGGAVVLVGRSSDDTGRVRGAMATTPALDLTDKTDLPTLGGVLRRVDLLVTNDGGPMHIAAAVGTPVVAVFGLSNDAAYGPWDGGLPPRLWPPRALAPARHSRHTVVKLDLNCMPCFYRGLRLGAPQGCPTRECLEMLSPALVLGAVEASLTALAAH